MIPAIEVISAAPQSAGGVRVVAGTPPATNTSAGTAPSGAIRISVVIPTFNEAENLPFVFARLPADLHEVIVVDGHSVDGTVDVARTLRPDVKIVLQNRRGKGNAMACGFAAVTGDVVIMLDADGSADPLEIPRFVAALCAGADFAKGTRFAPGGGSSDITPLRAWGNRRLNRVANLLYATQYTDLCYGYNAFWTRCLPALRLSAAGPGCDTRLWGDGFEIETIINTRIAKAHLKIVEVPSFEATRRCGASNLNTWRDGFRVLRALAAERVSGVRMADRWARPSPDGQQGARSGVPVAAFATTMVTGIWVAASWPPQRTIRRRRRSALSGGEPTLPQPS